MGSLRCSMWHVFCSVRLYGVVYHSLCLKHLKRYKTTWKILCTALIQGHVVMCQQGNPTLQRHDDFFLFFFLVIEACCVRTWHFSKPILSRHGEMHICSGVEYMQSNLLFPFFSYQNSPNNKHFWNEENSSLNPHLQDLLKQLLSAIFSVLV